MKNKLIWAAEHWFLLPVSAFLIMMILSFAGVKPAVPEADRHLEYAEYDGSGLVWQYTLKSTCFSAIAYDDGCEMLALIFRSNEDRAYVYSEFLERDYQEFISSSSLGGYYNQNIKGQYPCRRTDDIEGTWFEP